MHLYRIMFIIALSGRVFDVVTTSGKGIFYRFANVFFIER